MAMAAARAGARKLGGFALRPPQATAAVERSPLALLRPLHSQAKAQKAESLLAEIQETKEELFTQMFENREVLGVENCGLLKHLCLHVKPRPDDPAWCFYRRAKFINLFFKYGGLCLFSYAATHDYMNYRESKEAAEASNKQEKQEQPLV